MQHGTSHAVLPAESASASAIASAGAGNPGAVHISRTTHAVAEAHKSSPQATNRLPPRLRLVQAGRVARSSSVQNHTKTCSMQHAAIILRIESGSCPAHRGTMGTGELGVEVAGDWPREGLDWL